MVGRPFVVGIKEGHPLSPGFGHTTVAGHGDTAVRLADEADAPVADGNDLVGTVVGASVVDHDGLEISIGLRQHAIKTATDIGCFVPKGDDDANHGGYAF